MVALPCDHLYHLRLSPRVNPLCNLQESRHQFLHPFRQLSLLPNLLGQRKDLVPYQLLSLAIHDGIHITELNGLLQIQHLYLLLSPLLILLAPHLCRL